jgi:hypothetical protein
LAAAILAIAQLTRRLAIDRASHRETPVEQLREDSAPDRELERIA